MSEPAALIAQVRALPAGRGFVRPGASPESLDEVERDLGRHLPVDLRELLLQSDGIGVAEVTGCYLESVAGLYRLNGDDLFVSRFPGALFVGNDGASGLYLVDVDGRFAPNAGAVLLTDMGSLTLDETVVAGSSVSQLLTDVLAGRDPWKAPRLG